VDDVAIRLTDVTKTFSGHQAVKALSLSIPRGCVFGLLGPNGAGKTTTFYMIVGLVKPNEGIVRFDDQTVTTWPMFRRARAGVGYLPQEASVFRKLNVADNIRLVMELHGNSRKEIDAKIKELSEELHIVKILDQNAGVLSGGERRRVEIARALATDPKFILLDEPFTGIDPVTIEELQEIIHKLKKQGIGVLITDHNVSATLRITDRNYILIDGKIIASGNASQISNNDLVRKHYLGQQFASIAAEDPVSGKTSADSETE
jgi:lipopolysaccharide export system ATP-binding protein